MTTGQLIDILHNGKHSCVITNNDEIRTFDQRGVTDLFNIVTSDVKFLNGASIADKVIGKGAAALLILGGVNSIHADVISVPALDMVVKNHISITYNLAVPYIINRAGNGKCPVETLCADTDNIHEIYNIIKDFLSRQQLKNNTI